MVVALSPLLHLLPHHDAWLLLWVHTVLHKALVTVLSDFDLKVGSLLGMEAGKTGASGA